MVVSVPTYNVMIVMDIQFAGGSAHGTGSGPGSASSSHWGGAGYEVQIVQIVCATPCKRETLCKRALTVARQNVLQAGIRYNWQSQGLRVKTVSCTVI